MASLLKFNICLEDCKSFIFTETTGVYENPDNLTGWNGPNANLALATVATLDVYAPNASTPTITIDLLATSSFPTIDDTLEYEITNTALGYSGRLPDGVWKFKYTVVVVDGVTTTYQQTIEKTTYCNAKCCVDKLFAGIEDFECDCMEEAINKAINARAIYDGMVAAAECGQKATFVKLQKMLERMCNNTNCCN